MVSLEDAAERVVRVFGRDNLVRARVEALPAAMVSERTRWFLTEVGLPFGTPALLEPYPELRTGMRSQAEGHPDREWSQDEADLVPFGSWAGLVVLCLEPPTGRVVMIDGAGELHVTASDVACFAHAAAAVEEFLRRADDLVEPFPDDDGGQEMLIPHDAWEREVEALWAELDTADPGVPTDREMGYWPCCVEGVVEYLALPEGIVDYRWQAPASPDPYEEDAAAIRALLGGDALRRFSVEDLIGVGGTSSGHRLLRHVGVPSAVGRCFTAPGYGEPLQMAEFALHHQLPAPDEALRSWARLGVDWAGRAVCMGTGDRVFVLEPDCPEPVEVSGSVDWFVPALALLEHLLRDADHRPDGAAGAVRRFREVLAGGDGWVGADPTHVPDALRFLVDDIRRRTEHLGVDDHGWWTSLLAQAEADDGRTANQ